MSTHNPFLSQLRKVASAVSVHISMPLVSPHSIRMSMRMSTHVPIIRQTPNWVGRVYTHVCAYVYAHVYAHVYTHVYTRAPSVRHRTGLGCGRARCAARGGAYPLTMQRAHALAHTTLSTSAMGWVYMPGGSPAARTCVYRHMHRHVCRRVYTPGTQFPRGERERAASRSRARCGAGDSARRSRRHRGKAGGGG